MDIIQDNLVFWALWLVTAVICGYLLWQSSLQPVTILGFIPLLAMMFGYFYVVQAAVVAINLSHKLTPNMLALGQLMVLACLIASILGWRFGFRQAVHGVGLTSTKRIVPNVNSLWTIGLCSIIVGIFGQYSFWASGGDFNTSAYWYLLFYVAYPGIAICLTIVSREPAYRSGGSAILLLFLMAILMYPWIIMARRGPVFPFTISVVYAFYMSRPKQVNRSLVISALASAGIVMLLLVTIRDYSRSKETGIGISTERLQNLTATDILLGKAYEEADNEYLYHCVGIMAYAESNKFQWGTGYLSLLSHWIPRTWWPDKPELGVGWFDTMSRMEILEVTGVMTTTGAAYGGIFETFLEFGWVVPAFWFAISWGLARVYVVGLRRPDTVAPLIYVGCLAASHWLISQGFRAAFIPGMVFITVPILAFAVAGKTVPAIVSRPASKERAAA